MNHGKVRIYELSRELNLDNKDILAVCEQLNIAVKSHSSTITEDEAERIRTYSDKYLASQHEAKASVTRGSQEDAESPEDSPSPDSKNKLEIRKYKSRSQNKRSGASSSSNEEPDPALLEPPAGQQPDSPMNKTHLSRPSHPSQTGETSKVASTTFAPSQEATQSHSESQSDPTQLTNVSPPPATTQTKAEKQSLTGPIQPPRRPEPPKPISPPARPTGGTKNSTYEQKERPILKQDKDKRRPVGQPKAKIGANADTISEITPKPKANKPPVPRNKLAAKEGGASKEGAVSTPGVPELQRPRREIRGPNKPKTAGDISEEVLTGVLSDGESEDDEILTEEVTVKRPVHPKSLKSKGKKPKQKKDNEEELAEVAEKLAKAGTKAKRRPKPIKDEDDDDLDGLNSRPAATPVSLSIARPPKAKSVSTTPTPAPAKAKKPKPSDSGSGSGRNRFRREQPQKKQRPEQVVLTGSLTVRELAEGLEIAETEIVKTLFFKGIPVNITQTLDLETATMVAEELGVEVITAEVESKAKKLRKFLGEQNRPPVVTIMGHVDHGKTTLLDAIRNTKVAQGEAGGITQHIGAYHVDVEHKGQESQVVFLDTPGHEAFTAMRARGTRVTDIAILVVAADDGIQPQTLEAIGHAKAAEVPMIVAINKIDKEDAQPDRVKQELAERGLLWEEWGGDTIIVPISAIKGEGLDELLEMILLVAEIEELSANPDLKAVGTVIEAHLDKAKGPVASLLVQNGTLRVGDLVVAGSAIGKVRAMTDDRGNRVEEARPSFAVEILGLGDVPAAGDEFEVFETEKEARSIAAVRVDEKRESRLQQAMASRRVTLNSLSAQAKEGQLKELNLILKADVQGSLEAILQSLGQLPQGEVQIRVLLAAPGEVTETDVDLASASGAVILGFNTSLALGARQASDEAGVDVRDYDIIYNLLDDVRGAMEGLLDPELVEEPLGQAEVRAVFPVGKGAVAGCYIREGKVIRNCKVRVLRNGKVIHEGVLDSLKRMKEDAREVNTGFECGIGLDSFKDWVEGDIISAFRMVSKRRTLSAN